MTRGQLPQRAGSLGLTAVGLPPRYPPSKEGGVGKFSDFLALSVNISKTVADTAKVTIND